MRMITNRKLLVACLSVLLLTGIAHAQIPKPTLNITGTYYFEQPTGKLWLYDLTVTQAQYLDGSTSAADPIVGASFVIGGNYGDPATAGEMVFTGIDPISGDAMFTNASVVVSKAGVTYMTGTLQNVRLSEFGMGSFGNINVGFEDTNVTNLVFGAGTGSQFVEEFSTLIAPPGVPDAGSVQIEMQLLMAFGETPITFEDNFTVSSYGNVLAVFDGAPVDECPDDPNKTEPGQCGCGVPDTDTDGDGVADCNDLCPEDPNKDEPGVCGCGVPDDDTDDDGVLDCNDPCPNDADKIDPGQCGCGVPDTDTDGDGIADCNDGCPTDADKIDPGICGCHVADTDTDADGTADCNDLCPEDAGKVEPGICGCGIADTDTDGDGTADCNDLCPEDPAKVGPGQCGCGVADTDTDTDGTADCNDACPTDSAKTSPGICGCGVADTDSDGDGTPDCNDQCPSDTNKIDPGQCGCGEADTDSDGDGIADCNDACPTDPYKVDPGQCGCGIDDTDSDNDGVADCNDMCPDDPEKTAPGQCGCGAPDTDSDGDTVADCVDSCPNDPAKTEPGICGCGVSDVDSDGDGTADCNDACPDDANKAEPGQCGCGIPDTDSDGDGVADCNDRCNGEPDVDSDGDGLLDCEDGCPLDPDKAEPGICGCGESDVDSDGDGVADCNDACSDDPMKTAPGQCGCGAADTDSDGDGVADCNDACPADPDKTSPGICGCGVPDTDSDGDGTADCNDACPADPGKTAPGQCGCGVPDTDSDGDGVADCNDACPEDPAKIEPGICGCGVADIDSDADGVADCNDACPTDPNKIQPGQCGCGEADTDSDDDGTADCVDLCPDDPAKIGPGVCGCGVADTDSDGDGTPDCVDECPEDPNKVLAGQCGCGNPETGDTDGDGTADCVDGCPADPNKTDPGHCGCGIADIDADNDGIADCLCNLSVTVDACVVPPPPATGTDCQGKVMEMTLQYVGGGCEASDNDQHYRKVRCSGNAATSEPVRIVVSNKKAKRGWWRKCRHGKKKHKNKNIYTTVDDVMLNDLIEVDARSAGRKTLTAQTWVRIYNADDKLLEDILFHTSCSQPLNVGDQFGSVKVIAMTTTKGGSVTLPEEDEEVDCTTEIPRTPPPHCEGKVRVLQMRYTGGGCEQSNHTQSANKVSCSLNAGITSPVRIVASDGCLTWLDTGSPASVELGDIIDIKASDAARSYLNASTTLRIYNEEDELIEQVRFHTSCSQPLNLGDQFGSLQVFGLQTSEGGFDSLGADVDYTYSVTNNGTAPLSNVVVLDDIFGYIPGSPIALIQPGETVTLEMDAFLFEDTTNTAMVVSDLGEVGMCEQTASATVTVTQLPPPSVVCTSRITSMLLKYTGPTVYGATVRVITDHGCGNRIKHCEVDDQYAREKKHIVIYENIDLISGETVLSSPAENGWTIDAATRCKTQLGAHTWVSINGVEERLHTSCSSPFVSLAPAPLEEPRGAPSPNWYVMDFVQK